MKKYSITLLFIHLIFLVFAQSKVIDVAELTIHVKPKESKELFYGFAEGDQIIFNFEEINRQQLQEVSITELPNTPKLIDYKVFLLIDKKIQVNRKAVYQFKITNEATLERICKIKIQREPKSSKYANFNTNWKLKTVYDTTYAPYVYDSIVGYDTLHYKEKVKELVKTEQKEELLFDKPQRVNSATNMSGEDKSWLVFSLPQNQNTPNKTVQVIAWAYWIGVGEEATIAWNKNIETAKTIAKGVATFYTSPLGALALGEVMNLMTPTMGEDVFYAVTNTANKDLFMKGEPYIVYDKGKGVAGFRKFTDKQLCQGTYCICLYNDNNFQGIDATVKVIAIVETKLYQDKEYNRMKITPKYQTLHKKKMQITTSQIKVNEE